MQTHCYQVAVVRWTDRDEMAEGISEAMTLLGHEPILFHYRQPIPRTADVLFSFGPFGDFLSIVRHLNEVAPAQRPVVIQWNTEGMPDLRLPWGVMFPVAQMRSALGRKVSELEAAQRLPGMLPARRINNSMLRYRYVGDYFYAIEHGLIDIFADISAVYTDLQRRHGLPTLHIPWGSVPSWHADLGLARDVDVLWMGKRATRRRSELLDSLRRDLRRHGVEIYMADNEEKPFVFREERTALLNRAKITLNITRTWYDDNLVRFAIVAPNRSMIVSEPLLPHCPDYVPGTHYATAASEQLASTILHYLQHEEERQQIAENAYRLTTEKLTMVNSVASALAQVEAVRTRRGQGGSAPSSPADQDPAAHPEASSPHPRDFGK